MQVGDLVRMGSAHGFRSGIVVLIDNKPIRGHHTIRVHFLGHKIEKLNTKANLFFLNGPVHFHGIDSLWCPSLLY